MLKFGIVGDSQRPYMDPWAESVAGQILADEKLDELIDNGDIFDWRMLSKYPIVNGDPRLLTEARSELEEARERWHTWVNGIAPKKLRITAGNHEFRLLRVMEQNPKTCQLLAITEVGEALSVPVLYRMKKLKMKWEFAGNYPAGLWLKPGLAPERNVWIEHGYIVRKKAGYTATNLMEDRMCSLVVNHCEKLAGPLWKRVVGERDFFCIENGNLSIIGEKRRPVGVYGGVPHGEPEYLNHRQGFSIIYYDEKQWWPFCIKIKDGKAVWNGKTYRA